MKRVAITGIDSCRKVVILHSVAVDVAGGALAIAALSP
jgi:hypothetical protein